MRIWVDKIASSTKNVPLRREVRLSTDITARPGFIVAGRIRGEKSVYNQLEDVHGRMIPLHDGDVIAGVLGHRNALHGYAGLVPDTISAGDRVQLLNLGGVMGCCTSHNPDVGRPFDVEVLGAVLTFPDFGDRNGVAAHIGMNAIPCDDAPVPPVPVIFVAGTCMSSGKTSAACQLVRQLASAGQAVGACKLTGVSLRRDTLQMLDYGAKWAVSFTDAGIVTTDDGSAVRTARGLLRHLATLGADAIVAELGDGIMGEYGVAPILLDRKLMSLSAVVVMCANDPVAAWGAKQVMASQFGLSIDVYSGPATDNSVGTRFVKERLGIEAINARTHGRELGAFVSQRLAARAAGAAA